MITLVFLATVINYLDRLTLSVVAPILGTSFTLALWVTPAVSAFMLAYTISNGVSGSLLDRLGTRLCYALSVAWWSAAPCCMPLLGAFQPGRLPFPARSG